MEFGAAHSRTEQGDKGEVGLLPGAEGMRLLCSSNDIRCPDRTTIKGGNIYVNKGDINRQESKLNIHSQFKGAVRAGRAISRGGVCECTRGAIYSQKVVCSKL